MAAVGRAHVVDAADSVPAPFVTKHNQRGKGLGVRRFDDHAMLADYVASEEFEELQDGITLIQEYVVPPAQHHPGGDRRRRVHLPD